MADRMTEPPPTVAGRWRCGDHVHHRPTGETWVVAFADHDRDDLAFVGRSNPLAKISDCERVKVATDAEFLAHYDALGSTGDGRTPASRRLYAAEAEATRARLAGPSAAPRCMTEPEIALARHALGLDGRHRQTWRNHFVTGPGSLDHPLWLAMVEAGFAGRWAGSPITGGDDLFRLRRAAAEAALRPGETIGPETKFPPDPVREEA